MSVDANEPESRTLIFFNEIEASTVEDIAARIIPGDEVDPGAREAGALVYIDRTLAGFQRELQSFYSRALRELDHYCRENYGSSFSGLIEDEQDRVLTRLDSAIGTESIEYGAQGHKPDRDEGVSILLIEFFTVVREHVIQGTFGDSVYGGNRNSVGWKLVGFPGAQWGYSAEQMLPNFNAEQIPVRTLADLRREYTRVDSGNRAEGGS